METLILTGNHAVAYAVKMARARFISCYPITPQTGIVEKLSEFILNGELEAVFVPVESEHSAMAACIGASLTGVRTFTATCSHGLAYMHEMVHWASATRLPIVMAVVNRTIGPPWNIWAEHGDSVSQRDTGWIQLYTSNHQEAFDTVIQAYKIAEDPNVLLPVMVCLEGFVISHTAQPVILPNQEDVDSFIPHEPWRHIIVDVDNPITHGNLQMPEDWFYEFRFLMHRAMDAAKEKIVRCSIEFEKIFGRNHGHLVEEYKCDDADVILLSMGSLADQAKVAVDVLREEGYKVGALKLRAFRPFPEEELRRVAKRTKCIVVVDRNLSPGKGGALASELKATLYGFKGMPIVIECVAGLGGRDVTLEEEIGLLKQAFRVMEEDGEPSGIIWLGLK
ncbi:MAG: transketolase C-terminal domain-containing protein [Candidatus Jordarchaeales archaeon]